MNCLKEYTYQNFEEFLEEELELFYWEIWDTDLKTRINTAKNHKRFEILQELSIESDIDANDSEVLSWIDTLRTLYKTLEYIPNNIKDEIKIIQEYKIPFSKKRADYLLLYRNKILILEFSFTRDEEQDYKVKLKQVLGYKELMMDLLPNNIDIGTYVFLLKPERAIGEAPYIKINKYTQQEEFANSEDIISFAQYIVLFFTKEHDSALTELNKLNSYEILTTNEIKNKREEEIRIENKKESNDIDDEDLPVLIENYNKILEKYPNYIVILQDKEINEVYYFFNEAVEKLNEKTHYTSSYEKNTDNGILHYRKMIHYGIINLINILTDEYDVAMGTSLEDLQLYKRQW